MKPHLTPDQLEAFGEEMDALRQRILADLGEDDAAYIRGIVKRQQRLEVLGRALFYLPPAWPLAVAALSASKILENMEIGHNVMHGQYDWMGDPHLNSRIYEWDNVCPSEQWKYSHNYIHHTFTNILGKDRDIGYGILRMDEDQPWHPYYLGNPLYAFLLMVFFEWGVAMHDLEVENIVKGKRELAEEVREICERYDLPYNTGRLGKQLFSVASKICRMALPPRRTPEHEPARETVDPQPAAA